jgi:hypothetical protein
MAPKLLVRADRAADERADGGARGPAHHSADPAADDHAGAGIRGYLGRKSGYREPGGESRDQ